MIFEHFRSYMSTLIRTMSPFQFISVFIFLQGLPQSESNFSKTIVSGDTGSETNCIGKTLMDYTEKA